jgi:hypothetical protein
MSIEKHYPKPRHRRSEKSKQVEDSNPPIPDPIVSEIPPAQNPTGSESPQVFQNTQPSGQFLPESIEVCCPVCGYSNFSQNVMGETSCNECDYIEPDEFSL